jgi:tRNA pseudouridine(55) synthase
MMRDMQPYVVLEKQIGETPLSCAEAYRAEHPELAGIPLAYAGRLDPMASGKLLVLLGDECKQQTNYHGLDKEYEFSILFGITSDTHDVLGRLTTSARDPLQLEEHELINVCASLVGNIALPYPLFSAKTVAGKPLHMWTLENRLNEIEIPTNESTIYKLELVDIEEKSRADVATEALAKINTIPPVTDLRKALGNDFRRVDVRQDWETIRQNTSLPDTYTIAQFRCVASSGTYMRSLAHLIGQMLAVGGLAWHIHRTNIGIFNTKENRWDKQF